MAINWAAVGVAMSVAAMAYQQAAQDRKKSPLQEGQKGPFLNDVALPSPVPPAMGGQGGTPSMAQQPPMMPETGLQDTAIPSPSVAMGEAAGTANAGAANGGDGPGAGIYLQAVQGALQQFNADHQVSPMSAMNQQMAPPPPMPQAVQGGGQVASQQNMMSMMPRFAMAQLANSPDLLGESGMMEEMRRRQMGMYY